jgi:hypothetical protein
VELSQRIESFLVMRRAAAAASVGNRACDDPASEASHGDPVHELSEEVLGFATTKRSMDYEGWAAWAGVLTFNSPPFVPTREGCQHWK